MGPEVRWPILRGRELGSVAKKHSSERSAPKHFIQNSARGSAVPPAPAKSNHLGSRPPLGKRETVSGSGGGHWVIQPLGPSIGQAPQEENSDETHPWPFGTFGVFGMVALRDGH